MRSWGDPSRPMQQFVQRRVRAQEGRPADVPRMTGSGELEQRIAPVYPARPRTHPRRDAAHRLRSGSTSVGAELDSFDMPVSASPNPRATILNFRHRWSAISRSCSRRSTVAGQGRRCPRAIVDSSISQRHRRRTASVRATPRCTRPAGRQWYFGMKLHPARMRGRGWSTASRRRRTLRDRASPLARDGGVGRAGQGVETPGARGVEVSWQVAMRPGLGGSWRRWRRRRSGARPRCAPR